MSSKLRKLGKLAAGSVFSLFLSIFVLLLSFGQITEYNTLKPYAVQLVTNQLGENQKEQINLYAEQNCRMSGRVLIPILGENITLDCRSNDFVGQMTEKSFDSMYFRNYSCGMLDCLKSQQTMFAAFSLKANNFANGNVVLFAVLAAVSAAAMVYFLRGWGIAKGLGISMVFVGINYFTLGFAKSAVPKEASEIAGPFISMVIDTIAGNFLLVLIPGIVLAVIGIAGSRLSPKK